MDQTEEARGQSHSETLPLAKLWFAFFAYAAAVAVFVQFILLPHLIPSIHAGHGLLAGGDWAAFHKTAADLAQAIRAQGWQVWELRPGGQAPVGIAAALYAVTIPEPWVLIPLNAALHATAAVVLVLTVRPFVSSWNKAALASLPFLLYPSATAWYAQIHKDGFSIAGSLLIVYGWMGLSKTETVKEFRSLAWRILAIGAGSVLVWLVRPYVVQILQLVSIILALVISVRTALSLKRLELQRSRGAIILAVVWAVVALMTPLTWADDGGALEQPEPAQVAADGRKSTGPIRGSGGHRRLTSHAPSSWESLPVLPDPIDRLLARVGNARRGFLRVKGGSTIDRDWPVNGSLDVLAYLPRAAENALLAPYPEQWLAEGKVPGGGLMRRVGALEMLGVYLSLPLFLLGVWYWRRRTELWILILPSLIIMTIYAAAIPNIGCLHRMRYGFLMPLVALGIAAGFKWRESMKRPTERHIQNIMGVDEEDRTCPGS